MAENFRLTDDQLWAMHEAAKKREKERRKKAMLTATDVYRKSSEAEKAKSRDKFISSSKVKLANSELDNYNFARSIKEEAIQKKKNEPRKANEQVVGDRNFRIDKNNKIVIY